MSRRGGGLTNETEYNETRWIIELAADRFPVHAWRLREAGRDIASHDGRKEIVDEVADSGDTGVALEMEFDYSQNNFLADNEEEWFTERESKQSAEVNGNAPLKDSETTFQNSCSKKNRKMDLDILERCSKVTDTESQRRVTFHLPDGSQESCSDSGLGDHEPVGSGNLISHPLPLVQPQDEFYDQVSPDKRTEADGNSDPNFGLEVPTPDCRTPPRGKYQEDVYRADGPLGPRGLAEATEMCTQECLVLGHSDNCWMPPGLTSYQQPKSPLSTFAAQSDWVNDKLVKGHTLTRSWKEDGNRNQFNDRKQFGTIEGHFNNGNSIADIPLANMKSYKQVTGTGESLKEHQL
ncbi:protocadherin-9-like [Protopterus annectens]|uniref:protocadherin-9-like n=1 Tax=Protopterus annectens TaxID=7888 RepID=UPI001CF97930|nr:protocadherin-9-like [Protopterus annectens]